MLNYFITGLIGLIAVVGSFFPRTANQIWDDARNFGSTNFPTSLDTLTNPSATDSVATVSHSSQHANANDAIEAIEAKTGITASTPVANSILVGNGTGSSIWSLFATSTQFYATNFFATGSSTLQAFSFTKSVGTEATTTNFFSTIASTTNLYGTNVNGFGLASCSGTNFLQWSGGLFGCASVASSGLSLDYIAATSTLGVTGNMVAATTTSVINGQQLLIWATCSVDHSTGSFATLNVKPAGSATTTLSKYDYSDVGTVGYLSFSLSGLYTATASEAVEIYIGDDNASIFYENCKWPNITYLRVE